jgi:hypothetical protein
MIFSKRPIWINQVVRICHTQQSTVNATFRPHIVAIVSPYGGNIVIQGELEV